MIDANSPRRDILGALFGIPAAAAIPAVAHIADLDLIATVDAAIALADEINTLAPREGWSDERVDATSDRYGELVRAACAMPATTPLGRAAKARLVIDQNRGADDDFDESGDVLASLLQDILRGAMA